MKVSLFFITYRHERFVAEAIRSAMAQDYENFEIVVCEDASPDATREILERELENCPSHIRVIRAHSETNSGLHAVFNRGMAACTGELIVVMSGDDVSLPDRISRVVEVFAAQPRCMVVCSDWTVIDQTGAEIPGRGCHVLTSRAFRYKKRMKHIYGGAPVCGAAAAYRATLRDIFGPMSKGHHAEDNCYWFRGLLMGEVHYLARPLVLWRSHEENQSNWDRSQNTDKARAKYFHFLRKHQNLTPQWKRDLAIAHRNSLITAESMQRIELAVQFDREWQRLRRYSLACVPMKLWNAAAKRVLLTRPNLKVFRKTISQMHIRLSASRRQRFWRKHFGVASS